MLETDRNELFPFFNFPINLKRSLGVVEAKGIFGAKE
jgi:hypothetical protein